MARRRPVAPAADADVSACVLRRVREGRHQLLHLAEPGSRVARRGPRRLRAGGGPGRGEAPHQRRHSLGCDRGHGLRRARLVVRWQPVRDRRPARPMAPRPAGDRLGDRSRGRRLGRPAGEPAVAVAGPERPDRQRDHPGRLLGHPRLGHRRALRPADRGARARGPRPVRRPGRRTHLDVPDRGADAPDEAATRFVDVATGRMVAFGANGRSRAGRRSSRSTSATARTRSASAPAS